VRESLVRGQEQPVEGPELIEQGLRVDLESEARHRRHLSFERQVHEVLVDGEGDGEGHRVAAALDQAPRGRRRLDAAPAAAAVLLTLVALDDVAPLDDLDLVALLELPLPLFEVAAARGAGLVRVVEIVDDLIDLELGLLARAVTLLRRLGRFALFAVVDRALLALVLEDALAALLDLPLQCGDLQAEL